MALSVSGKREPYQSVIETYPQMFSPEGLAKELGEGLPGGPVVKNSPANAGDVGLIPGHGTNISHAVGATEPTHHKEDPV